MKPEQDSLDTLRSLMAFVTISEANYGVSIADAKTTESTPV